jgi:DNA-binding protein YbaB
MSTAMGGGKKSTNEMKTMQDRMREIQKRMSEMESRK